MNRVSQIGLAAGLLAASGAAQAQTDALFFVIEGVPGSDAGRTFSDAWSVSPNGGVAVGRAYGEIVPGSGVVEGFLYRWTPSGGVEMLREECPCDLDSPDNGVNVFDLLAYLDDWFAGDGAADIDGSCGVDVFDLLAYLDCWFSASGGEACGGLFVDDMKAASHDGSTIVGIEYNPAPEATLSGWRWVESVADSGVGVKTSVDHCDHFGSEFDGVTGDGAVAVGYYRSGTFQVPTTNRMEAVRWSAGRGFQMLPFLNPLNDGSDDARAMDVADDGNIIVGLSNDAAVIWNATAGTVTDMNAGPDGSMAFAVSANGQYAAGARTVRVPNPPFGDVFLSKGFRWDAVNGVLDLDPLGFSNLVVPTAVADDGQTVVGVANAQIYDFPSGTGFIWTALGGYQIFEDYVLFDINVTNENLSGWRFPAVRDMSPDGRIIVGDAIRPSDGRLVGFVLYVGVQPPM